MQNQVFAHCHNSELSSLEELELLQALQREYVVTSGIIRCLKLKQNMKRQRIKRMLYETNQMRNEIQFMKDIFDVCESNAKNEIRV